MSTRSRTVTLSVKDNGSVRTLREPYSDHLLLLEAIVPFSEVAKLDIGNANVRPPNANKAAYKAMVDTVESDPASFHIFNRGITYICERFNWDGRGKLAVTIPLGSINDAEAVGEADDRKFGIGDGGHTYAVVKETVARLDELSLLEHWVEPFVRIHFIAGYKASDTPIEKVVEALNTSSQVKQVTLDDYANKFSELKEALTKNGFDVGLVAFRENEDKDWTVEEIVQRLACFLKDRWATSSPTSVYRSKGRALEMFTGGPGPEVSPVLPEFRKLFPVIRDIITFPEFIQAQFSEGKAIPGKRLSNMRVTKPLMKPWTRPGTHFVTEHRLDMAALLPMAAAFRELLREEKGVYRWRYDPHEVFTSCAAALYGVLSQQLLKSKTSSQLGSDLEYWTNCAMIVVRAKDTLIDQEATVAKKRSGDGRG